MTLSTYLAIETQSHLRPYLMRPFSTDQVLQILPGVLPRKYHPSIRVLSVEWDRSSSGPNPMAVHDW